MTPVARTSLFQQNNFFTTTVPIELRLHLSRTAHIFQIAKAAIKPPKREQSIEMID